MKRGRMSFIPNILCKSIVFAVFAGRTNLPSDTVHSREYQRLTIKISWRFCPRPGIGRAARTHDFGYPLRQLCHHHPVIARLAAFRRLSMAVCRQAQ